MCILPVVLSFVLYEPNEILVNAWNFTLAPLVDVLVHNDEIRGFGVISYPPLSIQLVD